MCLSLTVINSESERFTLTVIVRQWSMVLVKYEQNKDGIN